MTRPTTASRQNASQPDARAPVRFVANTFKPESCSTGVQRRVRVQLSSFQRASFLWYKAFTQSAHLLHVRAEYLVLGSHETAERPTCYPHTATSCPLVERSASGQGKWSSPADFASGVSSLLSSSMLRHTRAFPRRSDAARSLQKRKQTLSGLTFIPSADAYV